MKIISWNVNGIRALHKKGFFVPFMEKYKPDILCLQETKAFENQHEVDLPEYTEYWNSAVRKGYSGVAIFTKHKPLSVTSNIPLKIAQKYNLLSDKYGEANSEGRVIVAEYDNFYIASVYTPNSKDDLSRIPLRHTQWDPAFLEYMEQLEKNPSTDSTGSLQAGSVRGKPVIFCGDLNVAHTPDDLANPKQNIGKKGFTTQEREGIEKMIKANFIDTFRIFTQGNGHYTWWSHFSNARARNVGWRIDYIFSSKALQPKIKHSLIHANIFGSDHCPIEIDITIS